MYKKSIPFYLCRKKASLVTCRRGVRKSQQIFHLYFLLSCNLIFQRPLTSPTLSILIHFRFSRIFSTSLIKMYNKQTYTISKFIKRDYDCQWRQYLTSMCHISIFLLQVHIHLLMQIRQENDYEDIQHLYIETF